MGFMVRICQTGLLILLALARAEMAVAQAHERSYPEQIGTKFLRGVTNLVTGVAELPKQVYLVGRAEGWVKGAFRGPIEGLGMVIARTIAGAYEVLTFPLPVPPGYQPLLLPEYVWEPEPPPQLTIPADSSQPALPQAPRSDSG